MCRVTPHLDFGSSHMFVMPFAYLLLRIMAKILGVFQYKIAIFLHACQLVYFLDKIIISACFSVIWVVIFAPIWNSQL